MDINKQALKDRYVGLLGRSSDDPEVKSFLKSCGIDKEPKRKGGLFDVIMSAKKAGLDVTFTLGKALDVRSKRHDDRSLVLSNIRFYGNTLERYEPFSGALPLGFKFSMDHAQTQKYIGRKPSETSEEMGMVRYDFEGFCLFLTYDTKWSEISVLAIQLPIA